MQMVPVAIEGGFAQVGAGEWLMGRSQPVACTSALRRLGRRGWFVRDRSRLVRTSFSGTAYCSDSARPFITHIPCAAPVCAVSSKVLVAPAGARSGDMFVKPVPMSLAAAFCATEFSCEWIVVATAGRTRRIVLADGDTLGVRREALVAWTGRRPTGYCPKLGVFDLILPRPPKEFMLDFHGPCIVWIEGTIPARAPSVKERRIW